MTIAIDYTDPRLADLDARVEARMVSLLDDADPYNAIGEEDKVRRQLRATLAWWLTEPDMGPMDTPDDDSLGGEWGKLVYWRDPHSNVMKFIILVDGAQEDVDRANDRLGDATYGHAPPPSERRKARVTALQQAKDQFAADVANGTITAMRLTEVTTGPNGIDLIRRGFEWSNPYGRRVRTDWLNEVPVPRGRAPLWPKTPAPMHTALDRRAA